MKKSKHTSSALKALLIASALCLTSISTAADPSDTQLTRNKTVAFGPYVALSIDSDIVKDVKVTDEGRIYLLLNPVHKEKEIVLKNSSTLKSGYRKWFNGEYELVSPASQGKAPNEYTDWVETTGNYIEYYMDGKLILHLGKASVVNQ